MLGVATMSSRPDGVKHTTQCKVAEPKESFEKGTLPKARRLRVTIQALSKGSRAPNGEAIPYAKLCVLRDPRTYQQGGTGIKKGQRIRIMTDALFMIGRIMEKLPAAG